MVVTDFEAERDFDENRFRTHELFKTDRLKVVLGYFEPGQFIPVHEPDSDVVINIQRGHGIVRDGEIEHDVHDGDVVAIPAGESRGVKADDNTRLEALLVTAPPPTDAEHEPVRRGLKRDEFDPA